MGSYPWVDTRPAKYLGANTSHIGEYLHKPMEIQKTRACAVARTPDLRVHRPFGLTTKLGEPGEGHKYATHKFLEIKVFAQILEAIAPLHCKPQTLLQVVDFLSILDHRRLQLQVLAELLRPSSSWDRKFIQCGCLHKLQVGCHSGYGGNSTVRACARAGS